MMIFYDKMPDDVVQTSIAADFFDISFTVKMKKSVENVAKRLIGAEFSVIM